MKDIDVYEYEDWRPIKHNAIEKWQMNFLLPELKYEMICSTVYIFIVLCEKYSRSNTTNQQTKIFSFLICPNTEKIYEKREENVFNDKATWNEWMPQNWIVPAIVGYMVHTVYSIPKNGSIFSKYLFRFVDFYCRITMKTRDIERRERQRERKDHGILSIHSK